MHTEKIFYKDPMQREFTAKVLYCESAEGGYEIVLDATLFYPEGGGQPWDQGTLGQAKVLEVREQAEEIIHLCDKPLTVGDTVTGKLDWQRRLDFMQQHTGEHILSGIICQKYGAHNVGFHMGADTTTIDFDKMIPAEDIPALEELANRAIFENIPVDCRYPAEAELENIPYRSKKKLSYPVRIVTVGQYDCCACCGTHTPYTGQVGQIKILSLVKFHQGVRMEIVCGGRALSWFQRVWEQNKLVGQEFSAKPLETGAAAKRMNEALAAEKFRAAALQRQLLDYVAEGYRGRGDSLCFRDGLEPAQVRLLAEKIAAVCGGTAMVFSLPNFCLANLEAEVADLGKKLTAAFSGRGGGRSGFFQGSLQATQAEIEAFLSEE